METIIACFASSRYWHEQNELESACDEIAGRLGPLAVARSLVVDGAGVEALAEKGSGILVIVPMSGAVQKDILRAAGYFNAVVLYANYISGNAGGRNAELMLSRNAAPALMDCWSILRKTHPKALLALDLMELTQHLRLIAAHRKLFGKKLLLIGETEPWVISVSRDLENYRRMGIGIEPVDQVEVAGLYEATTDAEGRDIFETYSRAAEACIEPTETDMKNAARMAAALLKTLEKHHADGLAIACFNLLSLGATSCIGVSYINSRTDKVAACEGDLDCAVTMLMLRQLTKTGIWMANPGLHPHGTVNFSHCTAPLTVDGMSDRPYTLRSHHESGTGASLQVAMPSRIRLTACRVSGMWGTFTVQGATGEAGPAENCCRTQMYVRFDDFDRYLRTALGCHQVFCFEDVSDDFTKLAEWAGLRLEGN